MGPAGDVSGRALRPRGAEKTPALASFFLGNDPSCWREALPTYGSVELGSPWQGIDVSLRLNEGRVEKLFRLASGVSEAAIRVRLEGARSLRLTIGGALVAGTGLGEVTLSAPVAYQQTRSGRTNVEVAYTLSGDRYGFRLGPRDPDLPVVIDPILNTTYVGGSSIDYVRGMAVDPGTGEVYVVGTTFSTDLPFITDAAQSIPNDSFVARFQGDLASLYQMTYLGGSSTDTARAVAVSPTTGQVIVAGSTLSTDFPASTNGSQSFNAGKWDAFVTRLEPNLLGINVSSYYGGTEDEQTFVAVAVHPTTGRIFVTGETNSTSLLFLSGGAQTTLAGGLDAYVVEFEPSLQSTYQATYYGGGANDIPLAIVLDPANDGVLIAGSTSSTDLPDTFGGGQPTYSGGINDGFVALLRTDLAQLRRSIYLGGDGSDLAAAMAIHPTSGDLYVAGRTDSGNLVGRIGGAQPGRNGGSIDFFAARLEPSLVLVKQTTYLGGSSTENPCAVAIDPASGDVLVVGSTQSDDFPGRTGGAQPTLRGRGDAVVGRLNAELTSLLQSTYYGGLGDDSPVAARMHPTSGALLLAGSTPSPDLPQASGGALRGLYGPSDGFVARITPDLTSVASPQAAIPIGLAVDPTVNFYANGNGVFEPGEVVALQTSWKNITHTGISATGQVATLSGPAPGAYFLTDDLASYGSLSPGGTAGCAAAFDCYAASITQPTTRPSTHWDASLDESLSTADGKVWSVHLGNSFADVLRTHPFYTKIETLLHNGVTGGCSPTAYCPSQTVTRDQMAIFLAKVVAQGVANIPTRGKIDGNSYDCSPGGASLFTDVQPTDPFCKHVHYLAYWGVTKGCTTSQFCPSAQIDRGSMAAFLVRGFLGGSVVPTVRNADPVTGRSYNCQPATANVFFTDVPQTHPFCAPIHYLWARGFIGGCGADTYCPAGLVTRDAMAKFLANTFDLKLYAP